MPKKKLNFEESLKRLDEITALLEKNDTGLDEALKLFEEGSKLAAECTNMLKNAKLSIEKFTEEV